MASADVAAAAPAPAPPASGAPSRSRTVSLVCHGHSRPINYVDFSAVTEDGYFVISASKDGKPMLRNGESGDWIGTFEGHNGCVWGASLSGEATRAVTASADFSAKVWDALTGEELHSFPHKHIVRTCAFAQDNARVLTGGHEKKIRVYDLGRPEAEPLVIEGSQAPLRSCLWHPADANLIVSCGSDEKAVRVWDVRTASECQSVECSAACLSLELSPDGGCLTTADGDAVNFYDARQLKLQQSVRVPYGVESASMHAPSKRFVAGGQDMWVHVHDLESGMEVESHRGHHGPIHTVKYAPGGESYASGSEDGTLRVWVKAPEA